MVVFSRLPSTKIDYCECRGFETKKLTLKEIFLILNDKEFENSTRYLELFWIRRIESEPVNIVVQEPYWERLRSRWKIFLSVQQRLQLYWLFQVLEEAKN